MTSGPSLSFAGVLLCGGHSSRMGENKALIPFCGEPLWKRQVAVLRTCAPNELFFALRAEDDWLKDRSLVRVFDHGESGPLGGILAALAALRATHLAVLAVDLPYLPALWFQQLQAHCAPGVGAIGQHASAGHRSFEPLAAIYPASIAMDARAAAARGEFSVQNMAAAAVSKAQLRAVPISAVQAEWFENWNTPADRKRGEGREGGFAAPR